MAIPINCPKCGFQQKGGRECLRCGIIFDRYQPAEEPLPLPSRSVSVPEKADAPHPLVRFYRVFRWVVLAGGGLVIFLILYPAPPPQIDSDPQAAQRLEQKIRQLDRSLRRGRAHTLRLDEAEINSWLGSNLPGAPPANGASASAAAPPGPAADPLLTPVEQEPTVEEIKSNVRDIKVDLRGDRVHAYLLFNLYGKDMTLIMEGRLSVQNGYLRLDPTQVKLGSLPVPQATIDRAVRRVFESPQNRQKFRVPPEVRAVRVENSQLIVSYR